MLSPKHRRLLDFITSFQKQNGWTPTYAEMAAGIGLKSRSGIVPLIKTLRDRGFIRHRRNSERDIEVMAKSVGVNMASQPAIQAIDLQRDYLCQAGAIAMPETLAVPLMTSAEMNAAIHTMSTSGKPYKVSVIVRLQELGGQG